MLCLLLQRRLAKLDENGEQGKGKELHSVGTGTDDADNFSVDKIIK